MKVNRVGPDGNIRSIRPQEKTVPTGEVPQQAFTEPASAGLWIPSKKAKAQAKKKRKR